jgi:pyridoxal phosphate enzyme (YggS family)
MTRGKESASVTLHRHQELSANLGMVEDRISRSLTLAGRSRSELTVVAVTKNFPVSDCQILYDLGVRDFGENRDSEGAAKASAMTKDITWHYQGQIQGKKIRSIAQWAHVVHSLDSIEHAKKFQSVLISESFIDPHFFFVQVNLEPERIDRGGIGMSELSNFLNALDAFPHISPLGLMTVAPLTMTADQAFGQLRSAREQIMINHPHVSLLSMGMSNDFEAAIIAGATHVRIGSSILGSRLLPA